MKRVSLYFVVLISIFACSSKPNQQKLRDQIMDAEESLSKEINESNVNSLIDACLEFVDAFPEDSITADYLIRAGELQFQSGKYEDAMHSLSEFSKNYPTHPKAGYAFYTQAVITEINLMDHESAILLYLEFIGNYPGDPLFITGVFDLIKIYDNQRSELKDADEIAASLFKVAELYRSAGQWKEAYKTYNDIYENYPDFEKRPEALFMCGFMAENDMKEFDLATEYYQKFLIEFPDHELADDVQFSLNNMGKTPEEIVRQFEKENQSEKKE